MSLSPGTRLGHYDEAPDGSLLMLKARTIVRAPLDVVLDWRGMIGRPAPVASER